MFFIETKSSITQYWILLVLVSGGGGGGRLHLYNTPDSVQDHLECNQSQFEVPVTSCMLCIVKFQNFNQFYDDFHMQYWRIISTINQFIELIFQYFHLFKNWDWIYILKFYNADPVYYVLRCLMTFCVCPKLE